MYRLYGRYLAVLLACMAAQVAAQDAGAAPSLFAQLCRRLPDARQGYPQGLH